MISNMNFIRLCFLFKSCLFLNFIVKALENHVRERYKKEKNTLKFPYLYRQNPWRLGSKHLIYQEHLKRHTLCLLGNCLQHGKVPIFALRKWESNSIREVMLHFNNPSLICNITFNSIKNLLIGYSSVSE